jgi:hypothetical protein
MSWHGDTAVIHALPFKQSKAYNVLRQIEFHFSLILMSQLSLVLASYLVRFGVWEEFDLGICRPA